MICYPSGNDDWRALNRALESFIEGYIEETAQLLNVQFGAEFLQTFSQISARFSSMTERLDDIFQYYNRYASDRRSEGYLQLFETSWARCFHPRFQKRVRFTAWMLLKTQPQARVLEHPLVREIAISICDSIPISDTQLRPIFLATRPLYDHIPRLQRLTQTRHWALVVGETRQKQALYEVEKPRPGIAIPQRKSFTNMEFDRDTAHGWMLSLNPIGYTSLSDNAIDLHSK